MDFESVKQAFISLYGDTIFNSEFDSFDSAFASAWQDFDFVPGASTASDVAEAMTECWQLTDA